MKTNNFNKTMAAIAVAGALGMPLTASAVNGILFDQTGSGGTGAIVTAFSFDSGNAVLDNLFETSANGTLYSQTAMTGFGVGSTSSLNTLPRTFTYQLALPVSSQTTASTPGVIDALSFSDNTALTGYFRIFVDNNLGTVAPDGLTGLGFGTDCSIANVCTGIANAGQSMILEGTVRITGGTFGLTDLKTQISVLGDNNGQDVLTDVINASLNVNVNVTSADSAYFRSDITSLQVDLTLGTLGLSAPFTSQVAVSDKVVGVTPDFGNPVTANINSGDVGNPSTVTLPLNDDSCNGEAVAGNSTGICDMQTMTSSNAHFNSNVPEPGSLALLGLGLAAISFAGMRNRRKA